MQMWHKFGRLRLRGRARQRLVIGGSLVRFPWFACRSVPWARCWTPELLLTCWSVSSSPCRTSCDVSGSGSHSHIFTLFSVFSVSAEKLFKNRLAHTAEWSYNRKLTETEFVCLFFFNHISHADGKTPYRSSQAVNSRVRKVSLYFPQSPRGSRLPPVHILQKDITVFLLHWDCDNKM